MSFVLACAIRKQPPHYGRVPTYRRDQGKRLWPAVHWHQYLSRALQLNESDQPHTIISLLVQSSTALVVSSSSPCRSTTSVFNTVLLCAASLISGRTSYLILRAVLRRPEPTCLPSLFHADPHLSCSRFQKPAPSPLHNTTAISPPTSASPIKSAFSHSGTPVPFSPLQASNIVNPASSAPIPRRLQQDAQDDHDGEYSYYNSDSSGTVTPEDTKGSRFVKIGKSSHLDLL